MDIDGSTVKRLIESDDRERLRIVRNGELVVLAFEDRLFLYSRLSHRAYEVRPDHEIGVTIHAI